MREQLQRTICQRIRLLGENAWFNLGEASLQTRSEASLDTPRRGDRSAHRRVREQNGDLPPACEGNWDAVSLGLAAEMDRHRLCTADRECQICQEGQPQTIEDITETHRHAQPPTENIRKGLRRHQLPMYEEQFLLSEKEDRGKAAEPKDQPHNLSHTPTLESQRGVPPYKGPCTRERDAWTQKHPEHDGLHLPYGQP